MLLCCRRPSSRGSVRPQRPEYNRAVLLLREHRTSALKKQKEQCYQRFCGSPASSHEFHSCDHRSFYQFHLHHSQTFAITSEVYIAAQGKHASCLEGFIDFVLPSHRLAYTWQLYLIYHHVQRLPDRMTVKSSIC